MGCLDVTFNLTDLSYRSFSKTNNGINYIHNQSNHPPSIIKQLTSSVESLSNLTLNEKLPLQRLFHQITGSTNKCKFQITS